MHLFIVRHGECVAQVDGSPHPDTDLTALGRQQATMVSKALAAEGVTHLACSPLVRALDTTHIIAEYVSVPRVEVWSELRENYMARHQGYSRAELLRRCPEAILPEEITDDGWEHGGDTPASAADRCTTVIQRLGERFDDDQRVAVITHGGYAHLLLCAILGLSPASLAFFDMANGALHHLYFVPREERLDNLFYPPFTVEVRRMNDTQHLAVLS